MYMYVSFGSNFLGNSLYFVGIHPLKIPDRVEPVKMQDVSTENVRT